MSSSHAPTPNFLWFLPTHGDGRYLGTTTGGREVDPPICGRSPRPPTSSAITAC